MVGITGSTGTGTGFFVEVDAGRPGSGYILTSYSLVEAACEVTVQLPLSALESTPRSVQGRVYAKDDNLDLALIEIDDSTSPTVRWADWQELKVGDQVFAFGYSRGLGRLVEGGARELPAVALLGEGSGAKASLVLTGIETIPELQGGPLLNLDGEVLGFNPANIELTGENAAGMLSPSLSARDLIDVIPRLGSRIPILTTTPRSPVAGRPVSFTLETQPNQITSVTLLDPFGQEAPWIYPEGSTRIDGGQAITTRTLGADACGKVEWTRNGFRDIPGDWTARITSDPYADQPQTTSITFTLSDLELEDQGKVHLGIDLRRYQGPESQVFYSDLVPAALAEGLQSQMAGIIDLLDGHLAARTAEIPDLYLMGNRSLFDKVRGFMDFEEMGFPPAAYFALPCPKCFQVKKSGIYLWVDTHDSETKLLQTLTHEYAHALVNVIANEKSDVLPIWVNEGFARWSENLIGMESNKAQAADQGWFNDADLVRSAALSGSLLTLSSMESQQIWNNRTGEQVALEYAEAYMAVRYLTETYGQPSIVELISDFSRRGNMTLAMEEAAGISYREFETRFKSWLENEEPTIALYQRGLAHYSKGEYQEAVSVLSVLLEINPGNDAAFASRGLAHYRLGEHQQAIDDFDESNRIEPHAVTLINRGASYFDLGQYQRAIEDFDKAIRLDADYASAYSWRASAYGKLGRDRQEQADREKACSLNTTYC